MNCIYLAKESSISFSSVVANGQAYGHSGSTPGEIIGAYSDKRFGDLSGNGWDLYASRLCTSSSIGGQYISKAISYGDKLFPADMPQFPNRKEQDGTKIIINLERLTTINKLSVYFGSDYLTDFMFNLYDEAGRIIETVRGLDNANKVAHFDVSCEGVKKIVFDGLRSRLLAQFMYIEAVIINDNLLRFTDIKSYDCTHDLDLLSNNLPMDDFSATFFTESPIDTEAFTTVKSALGTYYIDEFATSDGKKYDIVAYSELFKLKNKAKQYAYPPGISNYTTFNTIINDAVGRAVISSPSSIYGDPRFYCLTPADMTNRELLQAVCQAAALQITTPDGFVRVGGCSFTAGSDIVSADIIGRAEIKKTDSFSAIEVSHNEYSTEGGNAEDIHIRTSPGGKVSIKLSKPFYHCTITTIGHASDYEITTPMGSRDFEIHDIRSRGATNETWLSITYLTAPQTITATYGVSTDADTVQNIYNDDFFYPYLTPGIEATITGFYQKLCSIKKEVNARIILRDRQVGQIVNIELASGEILRILITHLEITGGNTPVANMKGVVWDV